MHKKEHKRSIKPYLLMLFLLIIWGLVVYEERLPEYSLQIVTLVQESYELVRMAIEKDTADSGTPMLVEQPVTETDLNEAAIRTDFLTLRILNPQAPTTLNPHLTKSVKDWEACRITYEPLASFDKDGNLIPFLAAEIPSLDNGQVAPDGKSVVWRLRDDVIWSDGEPFTAEDVVFTYEFITNPAVNAASSGLYSQVENVKALDAYSTQITFKDVNPGWALPFVGLQGLILPRHIFEPYNGENAREAPANRFPVGTGPYRVLAPGIKPQEVLLLGTQIVETNKIMFEPNPYFRNADALFFQQIEMRGGGTPKEAARLVMEDGQVDYAYSLEYLTPEELIKLETGGQGELITNFGARVERILLNRTNPHKETAEGERSSIRIPHPFFSDLKVRQAFALAIDRETIAELYGPAGRPTTNNLVSPTQYNSPHIFYRFNLERAKALLDEAGWTDSDNDGIRDKNGMEMKVVYQASVADMRQKIQQIVKKDLESIGVEVELKIVDPSIMFGPGATYPDSAWRFNADMMGLMISSNSPDPSGYMLYWTCSQIPQKANNWRGINFERWCNDEYDTLYQQATIEMDAERRKELFIQMNDLLIEDVVMIPIVYQAVINGVSRTIEGINLTPWDADTWNIQDWRRVSP